MTKYRRLLADSRLTHRLRPGTAKTEGDAKRRRRDAGTARRKPTPNRAEAKFDDGLAKIEERPDPRDSKEIGASKWTLAEIDQLRRRIFAEHGEAGKTSSEYIGDVLRSAGWKVLLTLQEEAEEQYEEEFEDLLHFKTLEDAEVSIMRLDELMRKFQAHGEHAAVERVLGIARLGKRRAEMISRNHKVEPHKRA